MENKNGRREGKSRVWTVDRGGRRGEMIVRKENKVGMIQKGAFGRGKKQGMGRGGRRGEVIVREEMQGGYEMAMGSKSRVWAVGRGGLRAGMKVRKGKQGGQE